MTVKRFTLFTLMGAVIAALALVVSAQAGGFKRWRPGFDSVRAPILEATGLDEAAVYAALKAGSTLAELIEANGGDVDSVTAAVLAQATAEVNARVEAGRLSRERADALLGMLAVEIAEDIHSSFDDVAVGKGRRGRPMPRGEFGFDSVRAPILEATGLDEAAVYAALKAGSTLAELIEANGGDVDTVTAAVLAQATAEVNARVEAGRLSRERADAMLGMLEVEIAEDIHSSFDDVAVGKGRRGRPMPRGGFGFASVRAPILAATGLDEAAVYAALKAGSTLAELIEANGGDVDSVTAAVLANFEAVIAEDIHSGFDGSWEGRGRHGFGFLRLAGASEYMNDMDAEDSSGG